jgi:hypothetical protein
VATRPQQLFDNRPQDMLKANQDWLIRALHDSPESLFFLFPADLLEFANRAGREGADR